MKATVMRILRNSVFWVHTFFIKQSVKPTKQAMRALLIVLKLKIEYELYSLVENNFVNDALISPILENLLGQPKTQTYIRIKGQNERADLLTQTLVKNEKIRHLISLFYQIQAIEHKTLACYFKNKAFMDQSELHEQNCENYLSKAKSFSNEIFSLDKDSLKEINKVIKQEARELNSLLKEERISLTKFDLDTALRFMVLLPGMFLAGGYIYVAIISKSFGIDNSSYFSVSDYFAVSINCLGWTAFLLFVSILCFAVGLIADPVHPKSLSMQLLYPTVKNKLRDKLAIISLILLCLAFYISRKNNDIGGMMFFYQSFPVILSLAFLAPLVKFCRNFTNPKQAFFLLFFLMQYILTIISSAMQVTYSINHNIYPKRIKTKIHFRDDALYDSSSELEMILANSSYYFLLDRSEGKVLIYPKEFIKLIEVNSPAIK